VELVGSVALPRVTCRTRRAPEITKLNILRASFVNNLQVSYVQKMFWKRGLIGEEVRKQTLHSLIRAQKPPFKPPTFMEGFPAARGRPDPQNRRCLVGQRIIDQKTKCSLATRFFFEGWGAGFPGMLPHPRTPLHPPDPSPRPRVGGLPPPKPPAGELVAAAPQPGGFRGGRNHEGTPKKHHERSAALGLTEAGFRLGG